MVNTSNGNETPMTVMVNGQKRECPAGMTLAALVAALKLDGAAIVAEVSGAVVPASQFAATTLKESDAVELVRFVGGG